MTKLGAYPYAHDGYSDQHYKPSGCADGQYGDIYDDVMSGGKTKTNLGSFISSIFSVFCRRALRDIILKS